MVSVYIGNRCYNNILHKTPYESFTGQIPDLSNTHIFGSTCYAYLQNKKKVDARSEMPIFIRYDKKKSLMFSLEINKVKIVRCVSDLRSEKYPETSVRPEAEGYIRYKVPHQKEKCKQNEENINTIRYPKREPRQCLPWKLRHSRKLF